MVSDQLKQFGKRISAASGDEVVAELVPAATVVLLRESDGELQTLMLRKNSKIAFAGMWVFPGGKIDPEDGSEGQDMVQRARIAAAREAEEETALTVPEDQMHWISHWTPPAMGNRRFATWFFAAAAPAAEVMIDQGEIVENRWLSPATALQQQAEGEIELAPPTFVTLHYLSQYDRVAAALTGMASVQPPRHYATRIVAHEEQLIALWTGDAGYDDSNAAAAGARHRLTSCQGGFLFEDSGAL